MEDELKFQRLMYITLPLLLKEIQCEAYLNECNSNEIASEIKRIVRIEIAANVLTLTGIRIGKENKCS